jgi:putative phage-type endonuclease
MDLPQGSTEWLAMRAGKVTASRVADVMAKIKSGEAAARRDYRAQLVAEILTGKPQEDGYLNAEMQWGLDQEPLARSAYEVAKGVLVDQPGFVMHPTIDRAGASPDGVAGKIGLEIKCPKTATHLQYLDAGTVPTKYEPQMLWQMCCMEAEACDFVSFDPRLPVHLQLFIVRFPRDDKRITEITAEVTVFLREVDEIIERLNRKAA